MSDYTGSTDQIKKIELPSSIQQVMWSKPMVSAGAQVTLDIFTHYVGNNSDVDIEISDHSGKKIGASKAKISGNHLALQILVPKDAKQILYAEVKLPKHNLNMKSNPLLVLPTIEITNLKWDKKEARRGDILKLTADVKGAQEGSEAEIEIWEYDSDLAHDLITKFPTTVKNNKIEAEWEFEYHEDTDEIPTAEELKKYGKNYNPPEYFFRIKMSGVFEDSSIIEFKDWIGVRLTDENDLPKSGEKYIIKLPDGSEKSGMLDSDGYAREDGIPPGPVKIIFPDSGLVEILV